MSIHDTPNAHLRGPAHNPGDYGSSSEDIFAPHPICHTAPPADDRGAIAVQSRDYGPFSASRTDPIFRDVEPGDLAYAPTTSLPEVTFRETGKSLYIKHVDNGPIHSNRMPSWEELPESEKACWNEQAANKMVVGRAVDLSGLPARDPFNGLPNLTDIIAAPARPEHPIFQNPRRIDPDRPGASPFPVGGWPLKPALTDEEIALQREYPSLSWDEIVKALMDKSTERLIRAGELTWEIGRAHERAATALAEEKKLKDHRNDEIREAELTRDLAVRLARKHR
jgi:hypothetical protein